MKGQSTHFRNKLAPLMSFCSPFGLMRLMWASLSFLPNDEEISFPGTELGQEQGLDRGTR